MIELFPTVLTVFSVVATSYFVLWNVLQIAMAPAASLFLWRHMKRYTRRARALADQQTFAPLVSIVVPAYNEELTVADSVRALMAIEYEPCEIVIVNDGSADETLAVLKAAFQLVAAPLALAQPLASARVRGSYRSLSEPRLVVLDKENGRSKADAVNAGINAAAGTLVLVIDADTVLEPDALSRAVMPFFEDPYTIAVGGNVAITNGCRIAGGRITEVALPANWLARFQIIEYMRAFLLFRLACALPNGVVIISGAFGLFNREAVIAVGGYDPTAIGEDMDLTIRLQQHYRERREPFRIAFDPHPLAWTQAPEDWRSLKSQRCRWRRGLMQSLWRHRRLIGNPRFGVVGLGVMPYFAAFEGLGPLLEISGYFITIGAALLGMLSWQYTYILILVSVLTGTAVTLLSVLMSDVATQRYTRGRDLVQLVVAALVENLGYRQLNSWWGCVGTYQALTGKGGWGAMQRRAFARAALLATMLFVGVPAASAQTFEVSPFGGYRFGGDIFEVAAGRPLDVDGGPTLGLMIDVPLPDGFHIEGFYSHQDLDVLVPTGLFSPPARWRMTADHWQGGGLQELSGGRARPFLTGMLGLTRYTAQGDSEVRFSMGAGGGVKLLPLHNIGVRLDGRILATFVDAAASAGACGGGGCIIGIRVAVAWQAEFSAALVVRIP